MSDNASCPPLEGNSDLYGLGIRIGIYLQWISTWIVTLVNPEETQSAYEVNSAFVFAVVIATIVARDTSRPIETYIMLQIAIGFFVTTLSTFGVRVQLLTPNKLRELGNQLSSAFNDTKEVFREFRDEREARAYRPMNWRQRLVSYACAIITKPIRIPLTFFSPFKPSEMAWSGVLWRTAVAGIIAGFNIYFWYGVPLNKNPCDQNLVFLFSKQKLTGSVVVFFRVVSIFIAVIIFIPALVLTMLTWRLIIFSIGMVYRQIFVALNPQLPHQFETILRKIHRHEFLMVVSQFEFGSRLVLPRQFRTAYDILAFVADAAKNPVTLSNVIEATIALFSGQVLMTETAPENDAARNVPRNRQRLLLAFCTTFNGMVLLSIVWFIMSIELTIRWNGVQGVDTIQTTGQLIPFIIGCVSISQVMKKVFFMGLRGVFPGWKKVRWEVQLTGMSEMIFSIKKYDEEPIELDTMAKAIETPLPPSP